MIIVMIHLCSKFRCRALHTFIRTRVCDENLASVKITVRLDHISHCKTVSGTFLSLCVFTNVSAKAASKAEKDVRLKRHSILLHGNKIYCTATEFAAQMDHASNYQSIWVVACIAAALYAL